MEIKTEPKCGITRRKSTTKSVKLCAKEERNASLKKVSVILQKAEHERSLEEQKTLRELSEVVTDLKLRWQKRDEAKRRTAEVEEPENVLKEKCLALAKAIMQSEHLVVYTGAGISTAARIPDYRGTNGIWTRLQQGKDIGNHDLSLAEPTFTHMALAELYHRKILKYVVSQNCDGLHLRSGLPRTALSELHGNMYIEVCKNCKPIREYWRLFDVTENTARYSHKTMRRCYICNHELVDTIVHFGERGTLQWPLNWSGACKNADTADNILCLGSSLKVLKRYPWLWQMSKPAKKRPNLYIVNLQWTPKDEHAVIKMNGKCDLIMKMVMKYLGIEVPCYDREKDPIFSHATFMCENEIHTTTQPMLKKNEDLVSEIGETEVKNRHKEVNDIFVSSSYTTEKNNFNSDLVIKIEDLHKINEETNKNLIKNNNLINSHDVSSPSIINKKNKHFNSDLDIKMNDSRSINGSIINSNLMTNIDIFQEQNQALDFSKPRTESYDTIKTNIHNFNCDKETHSSIKSSRLTLDNGSSSSICTLTESFNSSKRKSQDFRVENVPSKPISNSFSIDSILNKSKELQVSRVKNEHHVDSHIASANSEIGHNLQTIMAYYELANTVLQNQMLGYITSSFYPYQTSFLYPGFHSIINPIPFINYDFNCLSSSNPMNIVRKQNPIILKEEPLVIPLKTPSCLFCHKTFNSFACLFYTSAESKFVKKIYRFSKTKNCNKLLVCVCCDYSTEEDEDEENDENESNLNKKIIDKKIIVKSENESSGTEKEEITESVSLTENIDQTNIENGSKKVDGKIAKIQAGWLGKGYRKGRKIKKR